MPKSDEKITEKQLLNLIDKFLKRGLNYRIIFKLCKVDQLLDLTVLQYNYLLTILITESEKI